jgi:hypothetical protein
MAASRVIAAADTKLGHLRFIKGGSSFMACCLMLDLTIRGERLCIGIANERALEAREPGLHERRDGDSDQQTGQVGQHVEKVGISAYNWHQLPQLGDDSKRRTANDDGPDGTPGRSYPHPEYRQDDEHHAVDELVQAGQPEKRLVLDPAYDRLRRPAQYQDEQDPNNGRSHAKSMASIAARRGRLLCDRAGLRTSGSFGH